MPLHVRTAHLALGRATKEVPPSDDKGSPEVRWVPRLRSLATGASRLAHSLSRVGNDATQKVAEHRALSDFDVSGDRHARNDAETGRHVVQPLPLHGNARAIERFGVCRGKGYGTRRIARLILRREAGWAHHAHRALRRAVLRIREGV